MQKPMPLSAAAAAAVVLVAALALAGCGGTATSSTSAASSTGGSTGSSASVPFTVTVPAGTYQATVVLVTERLEIVGITASIQIKTWLAPNVGPVKELVKANEGGSSSLVADEELLSFTKG